MTKRKAKKLASDAPITILEALDDASMFGSMGFAAESWSRWRVFLTGLFGLPMAPEQLEIFKHHTGRSTAPDKPSRYATLIVGRRGGKTRSLALIATYLAACVVKNVELNATGIKDSSW